MGELLVEKSDFVATITLNRPERLNAISGPMLGALSEALVDADKDPEVRVVVSGNDCFHGLFHMGLWVSRSKRGRARALPEPQLRCHRCPHPRPPAP